MEKKTFLELSDLRENCESKSLSTKPKLNFNSDNRFSLLAASIDALGSKKTYKLNDTLIKRTSIYKINLNLLDNIVGCANHLVCLKDTKRMSKNENIPILKQKSKKKRSLKVYNDDNVIMIVETSSIESTCSSSFKKIKHSKKTSILASIFKDNSGIQSTSQSKKRLKKLDACQTVQSINNLKSISSSNTQSLPRTKSHKKNFHKNRFNSVLDIKPNTLNIFSKRNSILITNSDNLMTTTATTTVLTSVNKPLMPNTEQEPKDDFYSMYRITDPIIEINNNQDSMPIELSDYILDDYNLEQLNLDENETQDVKLDLSYEQFINDRIEEENALNEYLNIISENEESLFNTRKFKTNEAVDQEQAQVRLSKRKKKKLNLYSNAAEEAEEDLGFSSSSSKLKKSKNKKSVHKKNVDFIIEPTYNDDISSKFNPVESWYMSDISISANEVTKI